MFSGSVVHDANRRWHTSGPWGSRATRFVAMALLVAGTLASSAPVVAAAPAALPPMRQFVSTGAQQSYTVPPGVTLLSVHAVGAWGGPAFQQGGPGEAITAYLPVTPDEVLYTEVGQTGAANGPATFGGGGAAGKQAGGWADEVLPSSGGGATDVRTCSEKARSCPAGHSSASSRLIVAGGGGGEGGIGSALSSYCDSGINGGQANGSGVKTPSALPLVGSFILGDHGSDSVSSRPAGGGGEAAPGRGGLQGDCKFDNETFPGSVAGSNGTGASGGSGASAPGRAAGGSGGGGGYFGGGGGASGSVCTATPPCSQLGGNGSGGGGGSSFVSSAAFIASNLDVGSAGGPPSVTYTPVIEIASPANGATYALGQKVDASFTCAPSPMSGCAGTVSSGQPFDTATAGHHSFVVQGTIEGHPAEGAVTYTVSS